MQAMEQPYLDLIKDVLENGSTLSDRTGVGTIAVCGRQMRFDLSKGRFPLLTTKDMTGVRLNGIIHELLWFLSGDTNSNTLEEKGINIWKAWKREDGDLGPIYSKQWVDWTGLVKKKFSDFQDQYGQEKLNELAGNGTVQLNEYEKAELLGLDAGNRQVIYELHVNQIKKVIHQLKNDPYSRRIIVNSWNVVDVEDAALPPCHTFFAFYVNDKKQLDLQMFQRSGDIFLGIPYNIASYSLLLMMVAQVTGLEPGEFIHTIHNAHIYSNHLEQVKTQITRTPYEAPTMWINPDVKDIFDFKFEDFRLDGYESHPKLTGKVAI